MKELVVISGKGGTGKTSVVGALAALAKDYILADCDVDASDLHLLTDPQVHTTHTFTGGKLAQVDPELCRQCGVCRGVCRFNAISMDCTIDPLACEGCGVCVWNCPENAITFTARQHGEWYESTTRTGAPFIHAALQPGEENSGKLVTLVRDEARKRADGKALLLVDGPPGTGCPVIAAVGGADLLLIVTEPTLSAIHDMERAVSLARHFHVPFLILINKYDINLELTGRIEAFCAEKGIKIAGKIPFSEEFLSAQKAGFSVMENTSGPLYTVFTQIWQTIVNFNI